jgi:hypothetical protein
MFLYIVGNTFNKLKSNHDFPFAWDNTYVRQRHIYIVNYCHSLSHCAAFLVLISYIARYYHKSV